MDNHLAHSLERQLLMFMNDPYNQPQLSQHNYNNPQRTFNTFTGMPRTSSPPATSFENNYFIIRELLSMIRDYQQNIRLYNHNLTSLLHLLGNCFNGRGGRPSNVSFQDNTTTTSTETNTNLPSRTEPATPAPRREQNVRIPRATRDTTRATSNTNNTNTNNINETTTSTLLSYILRIPTSNSTTTPPQNYLNNTQIAEGTRTVVYDTSMNETRCPISLDDFTPGEEVLQIVYCGHLFRRNALLEWFMRNTHCPVCRHNLASSTPTTSNTQPNSRLNRRYTTIDPSYAEESNIYLNGGNTPSHSNSFRTRNNNSVPSEVPSPLPSPPPEPEPQPDQNVYTNLFTFEIPIYLDSSNNIVFSEEEEDAELNIVSNLNELTQNITETITSQITNNENRERERNGDGDDNNELNTRPSYSTSQTNNRHNIERLFGRELLSALRTHYMERRD